MPGASSVGTHLLVKSNACAGDTFWAAFNRLADRDGHEGHQRYLVGEKVATDQYRLWCSTCGRPVATMCVDRTPPAGSS